MGLTPELSRAAKRRRLGRIVRRRHAKWVRRIVTDESLDLRERCWQWWPRNAAVAEEAKAGVVQGLHLGPLLRVLGGRCFERATHLVQLATTTRTNGHTFCAWRDLEALAAVKASVSYQVLRAWHAIDLHRRLTPC